VKAIKASNNNRWQVYGKLWAQVGVQKTLKRETVFPKYNSQYF